MKRTGGVGEAFAAFALEDVNLDAFGRGKFEMCLAIGDIDEFRHVLSSGFAT